MTEQHWRELPRLSSNEWDDWLAGYVVGYRHGIAAGREHEREEVASLQRAAVATVRALSELPERDRAADEERAEVRRSWWARRRGEAS